MPTMRASGLPPGAVVSTYRAPSFATSISANGRYLLDQFGQPFLIVGASEQVWTNVSVSDMQFAMATRAASGFNFEWAEIITGAYENSTGVPAWATYDGVVPFYKSDGITLGTGPADYDVTKPYPPFWARIDALFATAQANGITLFANLLSTAAYWDNTGFFAAQGTTKLATFATWFANRYNSYTYHYLWGDDHYPSITGGWAGVDPYLAAMLNAATAVNSHRLHTIENSDSQGVPLASDDTNFTFGPGGQMTLNWCYTAKDNSPAFVRAYNISPAVPVFFGEGEYELSTNPKAVWSNLLSRKYCYNSMINGACGAFYGYELLQHFGPGWQGDFQTTAVTHVGIWKAFMQSFAWWALVPDTTASFVTVGNTYVAGTTGTNGAVTADGSVGLVYLSANGSVSIAMSKMRHPAVARWFDPTNGTYTAIGTVANTGTHVFTTSTNNAGGDPDWVLELTA